MVNNEIEEFIKTKRGKSTYKSWLNKYFDVIGIDSTTYFTQTQNYDLDVLNFVEKIKNWAPSTKKGCISCIKNFLKFNNIRLEPKTEYTLKEHCKGPMSVSQEEVPDRDMLRKILSFGTEKHKALFLTMASSGMRPGETISITLDDIHLDETPARIVIPYDITKTQQTRTTFISSEAKDYVKQWLRVREQSLKSSNKRSIRHPKDENDNRLFPFTHMTLNGMWNLLTKKAGFDGLDERNDKNKHRHKMTPHKLRKYFKSQMSDAINNFEIVESLMGHKQGVDAVYRRYTPNQLKQWYLKGEPNLLIFERPQNQEDLDNLKNQLGVMQNQLESLIGQTDWAKKNTEDVWISKDEYGRSVISTEKIKISDKELLKIYQKEQKNLKDIKEMSPEVWSWRQRMKVKSKKDTK